MKPSRRKGAALLIAGSLVFSIAVGRKVFAQQTANSTGREPAANAGEAQAPVQPIPYSHKKHLAAGLTCNFCHTNPAPGINITYPATSLCMGCHDTATKNPEIQKLAEYDKDKKPVPWVRVYAIPGWVFFNHGVHLRAQVKCESCHGPVADMEVMKVATKVTTMEGCVECHDQRDAPTGCQTCHDNQGTQ